MEKIEGRYEEKYGGKRRGKRIGEKNEKRICENWGG